ncbi:ribonuclease H-like domain-containing protein [Tanacetum coccineum]|uniref:Ribonuclease H-like domain-containing protein n=1 Tax=Tanacetum coccineum TaxID=301880 RepID=A0ABQ5BN18_9ASTR
MHKVRREYAISSLLDTVYRQSGTDSSNTSSSVDALLDWVMDSRGSYHMIPRYIPELKRNLISLGTLEKEGYTIKLKSGKVKSKYDYSLFVKGSGNTFMALLVYVEDIVITGSNVNQINDFKKFLKSKFQIKDVGKLEYFLGIEVLENEKGVCLTQRKYCLELLYEFRLLSAKALS